MRTISELTDLSDRKALITGGAGHIGSAIAEALVELGATVAILDQDLGALEKHVNALTQVRTGSALPVLCNLMDEADTRQAIRNVIGEFGRLDIVIHCAAYVGTTSAPGWAVPFHRQSVDSWDTAMRINLTSAFVIAQEAKGALAVSGKGSVIFISSIYGMVGPDMSLYESTPLANPVGYGVSKGGLLQLMRYLATVFAPCVRVNAISPGGVWREQPAEFHKRYVARTPLGRMATEEDVKGAAIFLASDLSAYVTGHNLVVDGGWTAW